MKKTRIERDSLGEMKVDQSVLWGAQTQRAIDNFPVSGLRMPPRIIHALGQIKKACAIENRRAGLLGVEIAGAIIEASGEVAEGRWDDQFPVDVFQTGSGTSTNMNVNEVIANRAIQLLGGTIGSKDPVHPNDHVNMGQSSNDVMPTAINMATALSISEGLLPSLSGLEKSLKEKAQKFKSVVKTGRTHLQDAVPVTLGQEFSGYATQVEKGVKRLTNSLPSLYELPLGGTAVGTGLNSNKKVSRATIKRLAEETKLPFRQAPNLFEAIAAKDALVETSGTLKTVAVSLNKIAEDIRWLASGPRCGIGELILPELQPGSSIMAGKVNPVMSEMLVMISARVIGNDMTIALCGEGGRFELNMMMPLTAYTILESIELMTNGVKLFNEKCIEGLTADREQCRKMADMSLSLVTSLVPVVGYDTAAEIAHEALTSGRTVKEVCLERKLLPKKELDKLLDPGRMSR